MLEYGPILLVALVLILVAVGMIPEQAEDKLLRFRRQCRAEGMDFAETEAAIAIRLAFVRLRTMASDCCMANGGNIERKEMNEIAGRLAIGLASAHGQNAAKSFIGWVDSCPDEEILYDDARAVRHRHTVEELRTQGLYPPRNIGMSQDMKDAFRIVRD